MSEAEPDVSAKSPPSKRSFGRRAGLLGIGLAALVLGVLAGALVLYVIDQRSGNEARADVSGACPSSKIFADAVDANAKGEVAAVQALDEPFDARSIAFEDGEGKAVRLGDLGGRTLLVNLWATWCLPCRVEMPALDALQRQKGGADFAIVPINVDLGAAEKPKAFYAEAGLKDLAFFRDETMGVFDDLKSKGLALGLPVTLLVDAKGCARAVLSGPAEWASPDALGLIDAVRSAAL